MPPSLGDPREGGFFRGKQWMQDVRTAGTDTLMWYAVPVRNRLCGIKKEDLHMSKEKYSFFKFNFFWRKYVKSNE